MEEAEQYEFRKKLVEDLKVKDGNLYLNDDATTGEQSEAKNYLILLRQRKCFGNKKSRYYG